MKREWKRLLTGALAAVLLLTLIPAAGASAPARPMEPMGDAQLLANERYMDVGGQRYSGAQLEGTLSGTGWEYRPGRDPYTGDLLLKEGYTGEAVFYTGNLNLSTQGDVTVQAEPGNTAVMLPGHLNIHVNRGTLTIRGGDAAQDAGSGIYTLYGVTLYVHDGQAVISGGSSDTGDGGTGILAIPMMNDPDSEKYSDVDVILDSRKGDSRAVITGGSSKTGFGGTGIYAYGDATLLARPSIYTYANGQRAVNGWAGGNQASVEVRGGNGPQPGTGLEAYLAYLDADGTIQSGTGGSGAAAMRVFQYGAGYYRGNNSDRFYRILNMKLQASDAETAPAQDFDGRAPEKLCVLGNQLQMQAQTIDNRSSLVFSPKTYTVTVDGKAQTLAYGQPLPQPAPVDAAAKTLPYGWRDESDRLYLVWEPFLAWKDTSLTTETLPLERDKTLFMSACGRLNGKDTTHLYLNPADSPQLPPKASRGENEELVGWFRAAGTVGQPLQAPVRNRKTQALEGGLWMAQDQKMPLQPGAVWIPIYHTQGETVLVYHGNGGTRADGSNLAVLTEPGNGAIYIGGDMGFQREGYVFDGWETSTGGQLHSGSDYIASGDCFGAYARWKPGPQKVLYFEKKADGFAALYTGGRLLTAVEAKAGRAVVDRALCDRADRVVLIAMDQNHCPVDNVIAPAKTTE